jgi:hypothetical protein
MFCCCSGVYGIYIGNISASMNQHQISTVGRGRGAKFESKRKKVEDKENLKVNW